MAFLKPLLDIVVLGAFCTAVVLVADGITTLPAERGIIQLASDAR
ncbi:hypothetical protein [Antarcticirhabdus aurantiaca]|uniref:Uncharacterized protein n=1 Tax=Antarcticirhabdus aurantiaca TaxID=2606717 RepID=A0ACD4NJ10_9HYPH|nr:hypothetical protein OXU80_18760 [Jeongeuplla avenae]